MTNEFCEVSKFQICKYDQTEMLILDGTFSYVPGNLRLFALWNGQRQDVHAWIVPLEQANHEVKHHLEVEWVLPEKMASLQLLLVDDQGKSNEILSCNTDEMKEHTIQMSVIAQIQETAFEENIGTAVGWAFSLIGNQVEYEVMDENGKKVRTSLRRTVQQRLADRMVVSKEDSLCGFILSFEGSAEHSYTLKMMDGSCSEEVTLASRLQKDHAGAGKAAHLFHMINKRNFDRGMKYLKKNGLLGFFKRLSQGVTEEVDYDTWFKRNRVTKEALEAQKAYRFSYAPLISIIVPVFNTPADLLTEMLASVLGQSYANWELCIADGSNEDSDARKIVKEYQAKDPRIKVTYLKENYGISGNTNHALALAQGEYTALFDHDDVLELNALYEIVRSLQTIHHDIIYTDEDKLNDQSKRYEEPNFKPDYNVDLFLSHNYITHFFVVKTEIIQSVGGFDSEYDGSQDYDVMFKCIEKAASIHHVPMSLYHWRMHEGSTAMDPESKMYCYIAGQKAIQAHLDRIGIPAKVEMQPKPFYGMYHVIYDVPDAKVSIVIPSKDHSDVLKTCLDSIFHVSQYKNLEIVIVENNSTEEKTFTYYKQLQAEHSNVKVAVWEGKEFNYSAINNYGVKYTTGDYILFLNNDTEMIKGDAISEMVSLCAREDVGAVGAKLLYADDTIQHAGVVIGFRGYAGHVYNDIPNGTDLRYMARDMLNSDLSAVTAACMMTKRSVFEAVHGFDEQFKIACNDIDYCLKVVQSGKLVVYNAFALWHHYESKSRGYENNFDKIVRFDHEVEYWQKKWISVLIQGDPYYNPNFKLEDGPFILK